MKRFCLPMFVVLAMSTCAKAQNAPVLTWVTNSSVKLEQIIGDVDWADLANGVTNLTTSQTVTRFHILGNGHGYSFEDQGKLIFLFGDTISESTTNWDYHAHDPLAWCVNTDGESGLVLNFYTNRPYAYNKNTPVFVQPNGIAMGGDDIPSSGISLSNGVFFICSTGTDSSNTNTPHAGNYSVLVTLDETNLLTATNTYQATSLFVTNRIVSALNSNLPPTDPRQGHFIFNSLREFGTNVLMFGAGEYRASDVYLAKVPTANFAGGQGSLYFTGLSNGQPTWSPFESNAVPVVQDNPTNGPPWPNDTPGVEKVSVIYSINLNLWLMTYNGGGNITPEHLKRQTTGIYFSFAPQPWGPWSTPQLIYNRYRDGGDGVFIYDSDNHTGPAGPIIGQDTSPTNRAGDVEAPFMVERFTRITNSTLFIYYTLSTWNPYTVVKMRSAFAIQPVIDLASLVHKKEKFSFSWGGPTNGSYQVDYSSNLLSGWATFTNIITSTNGTFNFTDTGTNSGNMGNDRFYRVRTAP